MTLFSLLLGILWVASGFLASQALGRSFGLIGGLVGFGGGALLAYLATWAVWIGGNFVFYPLPACRNERCVQFDYVWKRGGWNPNAEEFERERGGVFHYRCKCGDEYIRLGTRFMQVLPDGTLQPYKRLTGFRKWRDDS